MPELPEVETIVRQLGPRITNQKIKEVEVRHRSSWLGDSTIVVGRSVVAVERKAKILRLSLSGDLSLLIHLKMSGQLLFQDGEQRYGGGHPTADWVNKLPSSHTRVIISFIDGTRLFFNDQRIFGWIKVVSDTWADECFAAMPPDINDPELTSTQFYESLRNRRMPIKQLVLHGKIVGGVGNIYVCDGLHLAGISPMIAANQLTRTQSDRLFAALQTVIILGIRTGGATISNYKDSNGLGGSYQNHFRVYKKEGQSCEVCGTEIIKIKFGGRGTYLCPVCQKE